MRPLAGCTCALAYRAPRDYVQEFWKASPCVQKLFTLDQEKTLMTRYKINSAHLLAVIALALSSTIAFTGAVIAAEGDATPAKAAVGAKPIIDHEEEQHINQLHAQLKITPEQEA